LNIRVQWPLGVCFHHLLEHLDICLQGIVLNLSLSYPTCDFQHVRQVKHLPLHTAGSLATSPPPIWTTVSDGLFIQESTGWRQHFKIQSAQL
jgi:hypothetical protein